MKQLLSLKEDRPTAVFVAGDEMAMWAENAILEADLKVPEDISVIGFDDIPLAGLARIPLTTMKQPLFELGRGGIGVLAKIIKKEIPMPLKKLLSTELVKRKSCCPPKRL
jgi:LacI family transcriptional regulator